MKGFIQVIDAADNRNFPQRGTSLSLSLSLSLSIATLKPTLSK
jgi:hypothetical protein